MSEAFADLEFDRTTGELKGRGGAIALAGSAANYFNALWRARADREFITVGEGKAPRGVQTAMTKLRKVIGRFDLAIEGKAHIGRRLVDLRMQGEAQAS